MAKDKTEKKWFEKSKGFDFLESGGKDYFVHFSVISSSHHPVPSEEEKAEMRAIRMQDQIRLANKSLFFYGKASIEEAAQCEELIFKVNK
jgi:cold shock CspA family protein